VVREELRERFQHSADEATRRLAVERAISVLQRQLKLIQCKRAVLGSLEREYTAKLERMSAFLAEGRQSRRMPR
jgi:hypothetical protein